MAKLWVDLGFPVHEIIKNIMKGENGNGNVMGQRGINP